MKRVNQVVWVQNDWWKSEWLSILLTCSAREPGYSTRPAEPNHDSLSFLVWRSKCHNNKRPVHFLNEMMQSRTQRQATGSCSDDDNNKHVILPTAVSSGDKEGVDGGMEGNK